MRAAARLRWRQFATLGSADPKALTPTPPALRGAAPRRPFAADPLPLAVPVYSIWGANTNVGKTLVSVGLAHAAAAAQAPFAYVKPVQTGFPHDSDARLVALASTAFRAALLAWIASRHLAG
ncbi:Bifunctional dethiobiotin synthetase/7,8-diamino-pelargonic acid aminotransferase, mitochondrial [Tetrabaena socialis]|uniref:Bifunctional dethiobiotin synthetase/7,8-diamino-pelargonic acid aminotransferase, mitochondrial n=1 Tax=Tetrabaena socialis TaxID=47790 RepID=A0A2J8A3T9_9CHLO|nr:Bifunctional dethiobiotin synthetase/7,8-diamino-pelargonic acid aminotransferase, mitochondrial [Tetrabaena socialis]|eukprot:PNH07173.1 Bifunctional dethiobiotin synthetase/7,8-diamino-pelargonic acid aminotransferase, mitochondrial [Tetrabaena socialis]